MLFKFRLRLVRVILVVVDSGKLRTPQGNGEGCPVFLCRQCPWRQKRVAMEIKLVQRGGGEEGG